MKTSERIATKIELLRIELSEAIVKEVVRLGGHIKPKEGDVNTNPAVVGIRFSSGVTRDWYDDLYTPDSPEEFIDTVFPDGTYQMGNEFEYDPNGLNYKLIDASMENLFSLLERLENISDGSQIEGNELELVAKEVE